MDSSVILKEIVLLNVPRKLGFQASGLPGDHAVQLELKLDLEFAKVNLKMYFIFSKLDQNLYDRITI